MHFYTNFAIKHGFKQMKSSNVGGEKKGLKKNEIELKKKFIEKCN